MPKRPFLRVIEDLPIIATHQLMMIIGSSRYALDISTRCTKLKQPRAQVSHMVETFVYVRDRGRLATIIRLQDGKVSAAYSHSEPTMPSGLSAPLRWPSVPVGAKTGRSS
jgi:hypothetical protein